MAANFVQANLEQLVSSSVLAWTPGMGELAIILVICLVLFGSRLPSTMRSLGTSLKEFKKGMREGEGDGTGDRLQ
ncbi:MAG TPA: twin-arginine translocase TatA/TatE family subunit [Planctomycetaceae bacterium]|jgi:sec-independent protein translocase protein TatA|nr:twin-arginine translocase TatA/TatE family subunit [Planctomycetaceae bacterium]HBC60520.1 twin-arginine translocase TatA/TatE family subunit [Planctomycetaceae bacterium]